MYHAPFFPYIISVPLFFWQNPKALVLFFLIGEFITLQLTIRYLKLFINSEKVIYLSNLYLLLPAPLIIVLLGGQEDICLWGVFVSGLIIYFKSKNIVYLGLILSILLIALKFTAVIIFIPLFFMLEIKDKIKLVFSVAIPTFLTLGLFYFKVGDDLFMFIKHTEDPYSPNLYSVSSPVFSTLYQHFNLTQLNWIFLLLLFALLAFVGFSFKKLPLPEALPYVWIISFGLFNVLLPASMLYYTFIYLIAIWFYLVKQDSKINLLIFLIFNTLIITQPYLFVKQGGIIQSNFSFFTNKIQIIEYFTELLSVVLILFYCFQSWKKLIHQKTKLLLPNRTFL